MVAVKKGSEIFAGATTIVRALRTPGGHRTQGPALHRRSSGPTNGSYVHWCGWIRAANTSHPEPDLASLAPIWPPHQPSSQEVLRWR